MQQLAHPLDRLNREDKRARGKQKPGELACPGSEIRDDHPGPNLQVINQPVHGVWGVRGPRSFVRFRLTAKPTPRYLMHHAASVSAAVRRQHMHHVTVGDGRAPQRAGTAPAAAPERVKRLAPRLSYTMEWHRERNVAFYGRPRLGSTTIYLVCQQLRPEISPVVNEVE